MTFFLPFHVTINGFMANGTEWVTFSLSRAEGITAEGERVNTRCRRGLRDGVHKDSSRRLIAAFSVSFLSPFPPARERRLCRNARGVSIWSF